MTRSILSLALILLLFTAVNGQDNAYNLQRNKINKLLDSRLREYGQFQESLNKKTGIFGLKTKKDMQRSIDILSGIIATDNTILRETKVLLDYKDLQKEQVTVKASETGQRVSGYMSAINRLQQENERLGREMEALEKKNSKYNFALFSLMGMIVILLFVARKRLKAADH